MIVRLTMFFEVFPWIVRDVESRGEHVHLLQARHLPLALVTSAFDVHDDGVYYALVQQLEVIFLIYVYGIYD